MSSSATRPIKFLNNLVSTDAQRSDGKTKHSNVRRCLNQNYYNSGSTSDNSFRIGLWAKGTRINPPRDIDVAFELPVEVYERYQQRSGNIQSQLLQEVAGVL